MKFDISKWTEVEQGEDLTTTGGALHVMCSAPCAVYVESAKGQALAGVGTDIRVDIRETFSYRVEGPQGARVFVKAPTRPAFRPTGESFANIDRMPMESGNVLEVRKAMRMFELEQREMLRALRKERRSLEFQKMRKPEPKPEGQEQPEPEPAKGGEGDHEKVEE